MKQADRNRTGQPANGAAKDNQPPVMLGDQAIQHLIHYRPPLSVCNDSTDGALSVTVTGFVARMVNKPLNEVQSGAPNASSSDEFLQLSGDSRHGPAVRPDSRHRPRRRPRVRPPSRPHRHG